MLSALALTTVFFAAKPADTLSGAGQHSSTGQHYNTAWEAVYDHRQSAVQHPKPTAHPHAHAARTHTSASNTSKHAPARHHRVTPVQAPTSTHSASASASSSGSGYNSSALGDVPGVPTSFATCVAYRESTNNTNPAAHGNAYGIIPASGYNVSGDSIAQQKLVFKQIYDTAGPRAWAADGC
jgi:hypothetical protein